MAKYSLSVNGKKFDVEVMPDTPLLWVLRDSIGLTGTKFGCGVAQCGACTVHLNGTAVRACTLPVSAVGNKEVTTIEGLSSDGSNPVQQAWMEEDVAQCGYCQAGQIMTTVSLLRKNPNPTDEEIHAALGGHICRCGTYTRIKKAVKLAARKGGKI